MYSFIIYNKTFKPTEEEKEDVAQFLYMHLGEYGDEKIDILKCLNFAVGDLKDALGGFVLVIKDDNNILGVTIVNETGMKGYIPENILVYIAVHNNARGKGIGKKLVTKAIEISKGDMALHVEPNNPAKHLYEKLGFENKYLEMRLKK